MSFDSSGFKRMTKRTRKREFFDEMNLVVPWAKPVSLIAPDAPTRSSKGRQPPFAVETMLHIHFIQQWFSLSDQAMEEALYDTLKFRVFASLDMDKAPPDRRAQPHLERGQKRDPDMHSSKKVNEWHFGMKAHIDADADPGLVHTVTSASGDMTDVTDSNRPLQGEETDAFGDAGCQGVHKRPDANKDVTWHVAMRPSKRNEPYKGNDPIDALIDRVKKIKTSIRAKAERPFRMIKRQLGYA